MSWIFPSIFLGILFCILYDHLVRYDKAAWKLHRIFSECHSAPEIKAAPENQTVYETETRHNSDGTTRVFSYTDGRLESEGCRYTKEDTTLNIISSWTCPPDELLFSLEKRDSIGRLIEYSVLNDSFALEVSASFEYDDDSDQSTPRQPGNISIATVCLSDRLLVPCKVVNMAARKAAQKTLDGDLEAMSRDELMSEVRRLRAGIREHRDASLHELCWHHPQLWGLLPEKTDPQPTVPAWPQFLEGCIHYRKSLDKQLAKAPRSQVAYDRKT